jgi:hypothetical protein
LEAAADFQDRSGRKRRSGLGSRTQS